MESDEKTTQTCLQQLLAYVKGTVHPLKQVGDLSEEAENRNYLPWKACKANDECPKDG